jgi:hypothetical protein
LLQKTADQQVQRPEACRGFDVRGENVMSYMEIFQAELAARGIEWCQGCMLYNSHRRGFATKGTNVVHLKSAVATRRTLHRALHEIGHLVNDERGQKRWEKEDGANRFAENRMRELGIAVPRGEAQKGRRYVGRMKRWGSAISAGSKEGASHGL